ncbi:MAG: polyprenyl synthetase family protein [Candidatus Omnitrophica bacterium]|nr:polyprenyl synthetase family protein [Candidatus Omnitrophota bacterium]
MFLKIKNRIEKELRVYTRSIDQLYTLNKLSPILFKSIKEFILRDGKRVRPILFCIGYLGFSKKNPLSLYRSALSLELLHDFMLVHDDIIDKSSMRRGKPSMHTRLKKYLSGNKKVKFSGEDLAIVAGDVIYAMALDAFLAVKEDPKRKEAALEKLIRAALYTGSGEFIELLLGIKPIEKVTREDIYKIYDYKTANYTFASPLAMGATLAGAKTSQIKKLYSYGMLLGRAFQIKDDIIGTFGEEKETGKSNITDIKEAKRTLLIWYAFAKSGRKEKLAIKRIMGGKSVKESGFIKIREIIVKTGALAYAQNQIKYLSVKAANQIDGLKMDKRYKQALVDFSQKILKV